MIPRASRYHPWPPRRFRAWVHRESEAAAACKAIAPATPSADCRRSTGTRAGPGGAYGCPGWSRNPGRSPDHGRRTGAGRCRDAPAGPGGFDGFIEGFEEARQRGKDTLIELAKSFDLEVETIFTEGDPGHEIVRVAEELNADLIVLGTHGYSGWKRFAIGSVAELVVRHAPCGVLTIRPKGESIEPIKV